MTVATAPLPPHTTTLLAEGKTKQIWSHSDTTVLVAFKDGATAFNAKKVGHFPGKGALNAKISAHLFGWLQQHHIPTAYQGPGSDAHQLYMTPLTMIPLEVVVRNVALGSICARAGVSAGTGFAQPVVEFFHKTADDPLLSSGTIESLGILPAGVTLDAITTAALHINELLVAYFNALGVTCADFKLEFGVDTHGTLLLGDELSPDNFRLRDATSGQVLDKDVFRLDLADLLVTYQGLWDRMQALNTTALAEQLAKQTNTYHATVTVHSRKAILSPESRAITTSVQAHGFGNLRTLKAGKHFDIALTAPTGIAAQRQITQLAVDVLSNPVIEDVTVSMARDWTQSPMVVPIAATLTQPQGV